MQGVIGNVAPSPNNCGETLPRVSVSKEQITRTFAGLSRVRLDVLTREVKN